MNRRQFIVTSAAGLAGLSFAAARAAGEARAKRQFTLCLACGLLGISCDPRKLLGWASQFGFESVEPPTSFLATLPQAGLKAYCDEMKARKLAWGAAGVPVNFRGEDLAFNEGMKSLPDYAKSLQRAGVMLTATWLPP